MAHATTANIITIDFLRTYARMFGTNTHIHTHTPVDPATYICLAVIRVTEFIVHFIVAAQNTEGKRLCVHYEGTRPKNRNIKKDNGKLGSLNKTE